MQPLHRNYPPQAQAHRSPHATASRRGPGPIGMNHGQVAQHHTAPQHMQQQHRVEQEKARDRAKRLAREPTDKNMPDGVEDICIGDGAERYRKLREVERTLDATMMRKKMDISDSVTRAPAPRYGTMRIWISNTVEHQPWQASGPDDNAFDFDSGVVATYKVKIQGKLLDGESDLDLFGEDEDKDPDAMDEDSAEPKDKLPKPKPDMMSHYFKSITIDFDRAKSLQPDGFTQIEWKRPEPSAANASKESNFSELVFQRKGDQNINIVINLQPGRSDLPERFRLSKPLAELLDTDEEDRAGVMMGLWEYVKANHLQQDDDERKIVCDARLKAIFNMDTIFFPALPHAINNHLHTLPPIQLQYTIRVDKDYNSPSEGSGIEPSRPTIYDIQVALPDPLRPLIQSFLHRKKSIEELEDIKRIDDQIALLVAAIGQSKAKHAFFTSMAKDPVTFVKRWQSSQKRDFEVILGETQRDGGEDITGDEWRRGGEDGVWGTETARESVALWLARQNIKQH